MTTHFDIPMGNDNAMVIHCDVTMSDDDIAMYRYHSTTMHNDVAMKLFIMYPLLCAQLCYFIMGSME